MEMISFLERVTSNLVEETKNIQEVRNLEIGPDNGVGSPLSSYELNQNQLLSNLVTRRNTKKVTHQGR